MHPMIISNLCIHSRVKGKPIFITSLHYGSEAMDELEPFAIDAGASA